MTERIGLQAVLDDRQFHNGVSAYLGAINKMQNQTGGVASGISGVLGNIGSALGNVGTIAAGIVTANIFGKIADGITAFASTGLGAINTAQRLEAGLNALLTANNLYEKSVEQVTTATTKELMSEAEFTQKQAELRASINLQNASIQEQKEHIRQVTAAWGEQGLETIQQKARLEQMQVGLQGTEQDLAGLVRTQTKYGQETKTSYKQVLTFAQAQAQAARQSKELLSFVDKIAIVSPFEQEQVAMVTKYAIAAGLSTKETMGFTEGFLDLAAAVGIGSDSLGFVADQLLQVAKVGKLTEIDLRQLRRMGIDLEKIIGVEMGLSIEEFNAKAEKSPEVFNELFNAVTKFSKNTFAGSTERMSTSLEGLRSTFNDLLRVGGRNLFRPLVEAATPIAKQILDSISGVFLGGGMDRLGQQLSQMFTRGLAIGRVLSGAFQRGGIGGVGKAVGNMLMSAWPTIQAQLNTWGSKFWGFIQTVVIPQGQAALSLVATWTGQQLADYWPVVQGQLTTWGNQFWGWVEGVAIPAMPGVLTQLITATNSFLTNQFPTIQNTLAQWGNNFWDWVTQVAIPQGGAILTQIVTTFVNWAASPSTQASLNQMGFTLGQRMVEGIQLFFANIDNIALVTGGILFGLAAGIIAISGGLIALGGQIVAGLLTGIADKFGLKLRPWTISQFQEFAASLTAIDWQAVGVGLMTKIEAGVGETINIVEATFQNGVDTWMGIITETDWGELGKSIIDGILKGIEQNVGQVYEILKDMAKKALEEAGKAIGFGSPAAEFIPLGISIPQGLAAGVDESAPSFLKKLRKMIGFSSQMVASGMINETQRRNVTRVFDSLLPGIADQLGAGTFNANQLQGMVSGQLASFNIPPSVVGQYLNFQGTVDNLTQSFQELHFAQRLAAAPAHFDMIGKFMSFQSNAVDKLNKRIEHLRILAENEGGLFEGQTISALDAQEKLNQALTEQAGIQNEINQMNQQQAQLDFLRQQVDMLTLAKEQGLNVEEIFQGIQLGADASIPDLVKVTSKIIQAMLDQADEDLEIGSPSKAMFERGYQTGAGFAQGLAYSEKLLGAAIQTPILKPVLAGGGGGNSRVVNLYFGDTNISSGQHVQQFVQQVRLAVTQAIQ